MSDDQKCLKATAPGTATRRQQVVSPVLLCSTFDPTIPSASHSPCSLSTEILQGPNKSPSPPWRFPPFSLTCDPKVMVSCLPYTIQNSLLCVAALSYTEFLDKEYLEGRAMFYSLLGSFKGLQKCSEPIWYSVNVCPTEYFLHLLPRASSGVHPPIFSMEAPAGIRSVP